MKHLLGFKMFENITSKGAQYLKTYDVSNFEKNTGKKVPNREKKQFNERVGSFWGKLITDPDAWAEEHKSNLTKDHNGVPLDAGLGFLLGTVGSAIKGLGRKIFDAPGNPVMTNGEKEIITPKHQNLFNQNFVENDLPKIKSEDNFMQYAKGKYNSWGVRPGEYAPADEAIQTSYGTWATSSTGARAATARTMTTASPIAAGEAAAVAPVVL